MLNRKMFRDIKNNLSQFITIFLMILIGIMVYTSMLSYSGAMQLSGDKYYKDYNLFDLEVFGTNFTNADLNNIKKLDNVKDAERKLTVQGINGDDTLEINFIESNNIAKFYIIDGKEFDINSKGVWVDSEYADIHNIKVGDTIQVKYDTLDLKEKVIGLVNTPDHVYSLKDTTALMPDKKTFGYVYLSINEITEEYVKSLVMKEAGITDEKVFDLAFKDFNYKDYLIFNEVMVDLKDTSDKKVKHSIESIEDNIKNALVVTKREDNLSYTFYQGEIDEGQDYVGVFSGLFIFIALLSVITTMTRVVKKQRVQIGTLKALGFSNFKILMHYIGYGFWISIIGSIAGLLLGNYWLSAEILKLQMSYFEMPIRISYIAPRTYSMIIFLILTVMLITYLTGKNILKKNAAETLRNEIPTVKSRTLNITRKKLFKNLSFSTKWNIRDIIRNKMRSFMGLVGVTGCAALIIVAMGMLDSFDYFIEMQFSKLYNFDYRLTLSSTISDKEYTSLTDKYGDNTTMNLGIEFKVDDERIATSVLVLDEDNYLRFVDANDKYMKIDSNEGIYITRMLAANNNIEVGDTISWHIYGNNTYYESKVVGINRDPQTQNITMTRDYYESLDLTYKADTLYTNKDLSKVKSLDGVEVIQDKGLLKDNLSNMMAMITDLIVLIIGLALVLGAIIIYNMGILSYGEKQYQFATLKVLGFTDKKIRNIFTKQNNWIAVISSLLAIPIGYAFTAYVFTVAMERNYDFGAYITIKTYVLSFIITFVTSYLVSRFLSRKIKTIDMVTSLKANE